MEDFSKPDFVNLNTILIQKVSLFVASLELLFSAMEQVRSFAVPVLDFSRADEDLAADWDRAFSTVGFAAVVNHGLSAREVTEWARSYFSRSREDKLRDFQGRYGAGGYTPQGVEAVAQSFATDSAEKKSDALPDEVESFVFQTPDCRGNAVPAQYYADALQLTRRLMRISGIALNYDFLKHFERPECHLRLAQYPAVVKSGAPLRYGQHTDFTGLTLLFANPLKGFQLQLPSTGEWVEIELPGIVDHSDVLLVNSGDLIKR